VVSKRRLADTNLIVRYLVRDNAAQAAIAEKLFEASDRGDLVIEILPCVLAESVFVLESFYNRPRGDISAALKVLITSPGAEIDASEVHLDALDRYRKTSAHFVDCVVAATAVAEGVSVATFDRDFRKFSDVRVEI
jgi:predicted nucleic-acid-binding protein